MSLKSRSGRRESPEQHTVTHRLARFAPAPPHPTVDAVPSHGSPTPFTGGHLALSATLESEPPSTA